MKKLFTILAVALLAVSVFAQAPEKMTYQAVVRDADDNLLQELLVGMQISILQGSDTGAAVFVERHFPTTNYNGLVTIEIGDGTLVSGSFTDINWADGPYFIKTETDLNGGTDYTLTGTNQLLSVPYALHAKTASEFAETDPVFEGSPAAGIEPADIGNWDEAYSWGNHADEGYLTEETDPSIPSGTQTGEMQYWNGSQWITIAAGADGQVLSFSGGVPKWTTPGLYDVGNPETGKIWMDRNLGASRVAASSTDGYSYGDLFQWGRAVDGHQIRTSGTTSTLSNSDTPGHGYFILSTINPWDWRSPQNDSLWQGVSGINNPCPGGYRLPTEAEWEAERQSWSSNNASGAFASSLKLTVAGTRSGINSSLWDVGSNGHYWSSTLSGNDSRRFFFLSNNAGVNNSQRVMGHSVRCIKD
jgi:uncharacterized protein (TIGR02145 family)